MGSIFSVYGFLALSFGYLLGSVPFGLVLTRAAGLGDLRTIGSGNIGATNVLRTGSKGLAAATLLFDLLKGTLAVVIVNELASRMVGFNAFQYGYIAGLGAFLGHLYPVWLGFRGGKGVATYIGVLIGVHGWAALVFCLVWAVTAAISRYSSLAALTATVAVAIYYFVTGWGGWTALSFILLISALIFYKHQGNIRRLLAGEESKIGARS
jgi:acyl phosphate:glycerol-3-phosphate acyltransferase